MTTAFRAQTLPERVAEEFRAWEQRGRGWRIWPRPAELEPPFRPFWLSSLNEPVGAADDGRSISLLDSVVDGIAKLIRPGAGVKPQVRPKPKVRFLDETPPLAELRIVLPADAKVPLAAAEQVLLAAPNPLAFEVIGTKRAVVLQFACVAHERERLVAQIRAQAPEALLTDADRFLERQWDTERHSLIVEFGLRAEFMRPLRVLGERDGDALAAVVAAFSTLRRGEVGVLQVLMERARSAWADSIRRSVTDWEGGSLFVDAPEMVPLAKEKISRPLLAVVIRGAALSPQRSRPVKILRGLTAALHQFARPDSNELFPLSNHRYKNLEHAQDLVNRQSRRSAMLLNVEEVVSLVHLPSPSVRSPKLLRQERRTKAAPQLARRQPLVLGDNEHAGEVRVVGIGQEQRRRHVHVVGATGTGKSTLLLNLILQDLAAGRGFAVLDPHGDLVEEILGRVPEARTDDVLLVDPADVERPVGFNPLQAHTEVERTLLSSDLVAVFKRLSTTWGDQMHSVLASAISAILESERGGTVADLRRFLVEPGFRKEFLAGVRDPEVTYYWQREFPLLQGKPQGPILTRLDAFLRPKLVRGMLNQREGPDMGELMREGKIILVKLAQGTIGQENAALLGSLFVSKFHQLALARQEQQPQDRTFFTLFIDEFQHFVTPSMASLMTGARKFGLGLVLAHQDVRQLWNQDQDVASAVLANANVRVCFRVGDDDAKQLAQGLGEFTPDDLKNLGTGEAICRLEQPEWSCNLRTRRLEPVEVEAARKRRDAVAAHSRERYGGAPYVPAMPPLPEAARDRTEDPTVAAGAQSAQMVPARKVWAAPSRDRTAGVGLPEEKVPEPRALPSLGRGGPQHKYLQHLIAKLAQEQGWHATIEAAILNGANSVDVALEREGRRLAFQISVTTGAEHEMAGIRACLEAGFERVVLVAPQNRTRKKVAELLPTELAADGQEKVVILAPEDITGALEELATPPGGTETVIRGYRVKVRSAKPGLGEAPARSVGKTILDALKRLGSARKQP